MAMLSDLCMILASSIHSDIYTVIICIRILFTEVSVLYLSTYSPHFIIILQSLRIIFTHFLLTVNFQILAEPTS